MLRSECAAAADVELCAVNWFLVVITSTQPLKSLVYCCTIQRDCAKTVDLNPTVQGNEIELLHVFNSEAAHLRKLPETQPGTVTLIEGSPVLCYSGIGVAGWIVAPALEQGALWLSLRMADSMATIASATASAGTGRLNR